MTDNEIGIYLSRILSGYYYIYIEGHRYKIQYPSIQIKYEADLLAQKEFDKMKYVGWYTQENIVYTLIDLGIWSKFQDNQLKSLESSLEDYKVDLYKNNRNIKQVKELRRKIELTKKAINRLHNQKHSYDYITIEGYCDSIKNDFYLANSVYDEYNRLCLSDQSNLSFLTKVKDQINKNSIDVHTFRSIARSDAWRSYWASASGNIFTGPAISWTDEQKTLIVVTKMYDSARESMEPPEEHIYEDDDMFDGWMISQRRESEQKRSKRRLEGGIGDKHKKASEVFVMAGSREEAEEIYDSNDQQSRAIIRERQNFMKQANTDIVTDSQLPDIRRDIIIQSNQLRSGKGK